MHTTVRHFALAAATAAALTLPLASPAAASGDLSPDNDTAANATAITALPFTSSGDTTTASRDDDDAESNHCGGTGPTVWYALTPTVGGHGSADTSGSAYDTTLLLYSGSPGALSLLDCNDDADGSLTSRLDEPLTAGVTYLFAISGYAGDAGAYSLTVQESVAPPPPLSATLTIDRGTVNRVGQVSLTGTVTCNQDDAYVYYAYAVATQANQRFTARGFGWFDGAPCTTTPTTFEMTFASSTGVNFVPGNVTVTTRAWVEDQDENVFSEQTQQVRLTRVR
jgi:hypothetical protein